MNDFLLRKGLISVFLFCIILISIISYRIVDNHYLKGFDTVSEIAKDPKAIAIVIGAIIITLGFIILAFAQA